MRPPPGDDQHLFPNPQGDVLTPSAVALDPRSRMLVVGRTQAALYERFAPAEARRILSRIEFHFTPKHASWLNMVEIEIGVMVGQCLNRRIPDKATLVSEIAHWERRRNRDRAGIDWMFTVERAREKLGRASPTPKAQPARRPRQAAA